MMILDNNYQMEKLFQKQLIILSILLLIKITNHLKMNKT